MVSLLVRRSFSRRLEKTLTALLTKIRVGIFRVDAANLTTGGKALIGRFKKLFTTGGLNWIRTLSYNLN